MKVFVVNLKQSTDRRAFMNKQLNDLGVEHEFFPAVDGRKLTSSEIENLVNMDVVRQWPTLLTPGAIGCSLSHLNIYRKMIDEKIEVALILEDDIRLSRQILHIINEIESGLKIGTLNKDEIFLLYFQSKEIVEFSNSTKIELNQTVGLYCPIEIWQPITTAAYILTLESANRLAKLIYPIRLPADSWAVFYRENAIAGLRSVLPLPVESGFFKSDIGYEQSKKLNQIVKFFERKKVFPIPQFLGWRRRQLSKKLNRYKITDELPHWQINNLSSTI